MEVRCKKCGKPLHDPVSIARGMGPGCAGIATSGKSFSSRYKLHQGMMCSVVGETHTGLNLVSSADDSQSRIPKVLEGYPPDLVNLVLSVPQPGSIAAWIKKCSGTKKTTLLPIQLLKQIRRTCIEHRLLFWPGLSMKLEPIACIPQGNDDWKIGEKGRVINKDQLITYLSKYGIIAREQLHLVV